MPSAGGQPIALPVPWLALLLLGASALAYEVLLIRLFSVLHWHHFAYMAIGLALLGHGASGAFLAFTQKPLLKRFALAFETSIVLFAISAPLGYFIAQGISFNTQEIIWGSEQWWRLLQIEMLLMMPFFFAANAIGLAVCYFRMRISLVYSAELFGAGLGAISIIGLLYLVSLKNALLVIALIALLAALVAQLRWKRKAALISTSIMITALLLTSPDWPPIKLSDYKGLNKVLQLPDTAIIHETSSPLGLIDIVSSPVIPLRFASGVSLNFQGDIPQQLGLFIDGESVGGITRYDGNPDTIDFLNHTTDAIAFEVTGERPKVLIIGLGDGSEILQSALHSPSAIDIIEPNQQLITLFTEEIDDHFGWRHLSPFSQLHHADLRGWFSRSERQYDLIKVHSTEGVYANLVALRAQYPLTLEAFENYWSALTQNGVISVTLWQDLPPKATLRVISMLVSLLESNNIKDTEKHIVIIRSWQTVTILLGKSAFNESVSSTVKAFNQTMHFDPVYYSGITPREANQHNQLQQPFYYSAVHSLLQSQDQRESFIRQYPYNVSVVTDNSPYFYHFYKSEGADDFMSIWHTGDEAMAPQGYLLLWFTLSQALLLSLILIALPLHWLKRRAKGEGYNKRQGGLFFVTIGLAFLMVEWVMVEHFILFLSDPAIAGASVIGTFLMFSGLGSYYSQRKVKHAKQSIGWVGCAIFMVCLIYHFLLPHLFMVFSTYSLPFKIVISFFILAPPAFLMGMPFPLSLSTLARNKGDIYLPWAWGVNGCASVVSVSLATILSLNCGFSATLLIAATLYLLAAALSRRFVTG